MQAHSELIIESKGLSKSYRVSRKQPGLVGTLKSFFRPQHALAHALTDFDITVNAGESVGILGPNGAGKTTFMKILSGIIYPTQGELTVMGHRPVERTVAFRKSIALVMGQKSQLWWDIPAMDSLQLLRAYYEIPAHVFSKRVHSMAETLGVAHVLNIHLRKLSLGERMKMELLASLLHEPRLLILDEPTIGLDVVSQLRIREFISTHQKTNGTTVLLTSHYMADVESLCRRIVLVMNGKKAFDNSAEAFASVLGTDKTIRLTFSEELKDEPDALWRNLRSESGGVFPAELESSGRVVSYRIPETEFGRFVTSLHLLPKLVDIQTQQTPIEKVMLELTQNPEILT